MSVVARRYYLRGTAALERGDLAAAMESLHAAVDLVPTFVNARIAWAVAIARFGDCPRAAQVVRAGLSRRATAPATAAMWAALGDILTLGGDFPGAQDAFSQAEKHDSMIARSKAGIARVHAKQGRYRQAFAALKQAARLVV